MRLNAFALQVPMANDPGSYPGELTPYPFSFTLEEFVMLYWRVKSWKLEVDIGIEVTTGGYVFNVARSETAVLNSINPFVPNTERRHVQDTYALSQPTNATIPVHFLGVDSSQSLFMLFPVGDFPYGPRGFWTGNSTVPGNVIPSFFANYGFESEVTGVNPEDPEDIQEATIGFSCSVSEPSTPDDYRDTGSLLDGYEFLGKTTQLAWSVGCALHPTVVATVTGTLKCSPNEYFEFSNGLTPLWHSTTGVQLVSPLPLD